MFKHGKPLLHFALVFTAACRVSDDVEYHSCLSATDLQLLDIDARSFSAWR